MPFIDYQKEYKHGQRPEPKEIFVNAVNRLLNLFSFHKKKDSKLSGLMNLLVMKKLGEDKKRDKQRDALLDSIQPVLNQKVTKLVGDKIDKMTKALEL